MIMDEYQKFLDWANSLQEDKAKEILARIIFECSDENGVCGQDIMESYYYENGGE